MAINILSQNCIRKIMISVQNYSHMPISILTHFGKVLRDNFGPKSDVDVLVEFKEGYVPGLSHY